MSSNIFAGAEYSTYGYGGVYYTTNNGSNWIHTSLHNQTVFSLATYGNNCFAGLGFDGVFHSANNGVNWLSINQGFITVPTIRALLIANNYVFAGTASSSIWRRPISEVISIQNISTEIPASFSLSQNYPNPFNPTTSIKFDITKSSLVKISVFDITGKEIEVLVNEKLDAGTYQTEWNGMSYSSGVYFCRLITDGFVETKRMMLLK